MKTDSEYRFDLQRGGVRYDLIAPLIGHDLDRVGNIVGIYRSSMQEQDPIAFRIRQFAEARGLAADAVETRTLRDWFAGQALHMMAVRDPDSLSGMSEEICRNAYALADAMLLERDRK